MLEACGMCGLKEEATKIFQDIKKELEPSVDTISLYFQVCDKATQRSKNRTESMNPITVEEDKKVTAIEKKYKEKLLGVMEKAVVELSTKCKNPECDRYLKEEEIISAWPRSYDTYFIKCPTCNKDFIPTLDIQISSDKIKNYYFLFPPLFRKEINNLIDNKGAKIFYTVSSHNS
jgi:hypothetical protein